MWRCPTRLALAGTTAASCSASTRNDRVVRLWCCTAGGWPHAVAAGGLRLVCLGFPACLGWGCLPLGACHWVLATHTARRCHYLLLFPFVHFPILARSTSSTPIHCSGCIGPGCPSSCWLFSCPAAASLPTALPPYALTPAEGLDENPSTVTPHCKDSLHRRPRMRGCLLGCGMRGLER